jgi:tRNA A-37 threonylcarbamoyl transferase component Bud32
VQVLEIDRPSFIRRWLHEFFLEKYSVPARVVLLLVSITFFFFGPKLLMWLSSFLPLTQLGNSGASIAAHYVLAGVTTAAALVTAALALRPVPLALQVSENGIRLRERMLFLPIQRQPLLEWEKIHRVSIERKPGSTDMRHFKLCLHGENPATSIKLHLDNLGDDDTREKLISLLQKKAVLAEIESGAFESVKPPRHLSFTDLWLDALSAPPGRERLTPLADSTVLNDRFRIERKIGGGGQGTAYLATDIKDSKYVVLKETILPVYADLLTRKKALEDFHKEAFALETVKHPQIVEFLGSFIEDHRAYLVLAYIEGQTLRDLVFASGTLPESEVIKLALQMCVILKVLHEREPALVHRDFTPDNMLIDKNGKMVLIDFAVAIEHEHGSSEAAGKVAYMAPEQLRGISTSQTDIYSLGCALHFMLTGQDPVALTESHPSQIKSSVSQPMDALVGKATSSDASKRFSTVADVEKALLTLS